MKKLLFTVLTVVAFALPVMAGQHRPQSFIADGILSLCVSNTLGLTNLQSTAITTNTVGVEWTNSLGSRVVFDGTNEFVAAQNPFKDTVLWGVTDAAIPQSDNTILNANIFIKVIGQSGANSAVVFIFAPLPDGSTESTTSGDLLSVSVTANGTTPVTSLTAIPAWKWPGCAKVRLVSVTNGDTDATSKVTVLKCSLNGFPP